MQSEQTRNGPGKDVQNKSSSLRCEITGRIQDLFQTPGAGAVVLAAEEI